MITRALLAFLTAVASFFNQSLDYVVSMISGVPRIEVAQHPTVQIVQQQTQLICGVCHANLMQDAHDIVVTACNGVFHAAHIECMRTLMLHQDIPACPTCNTHLSESNMEHVLNLLNNGDARPDEQPSAPPMPNNGLYPNLEPIAPMPASSSNNYAQAASSHEQAVRDCAICLDELNAAPVRALPCAHPFHERCIAQWLQQNRSCPTCRMSC